MTTTYRVTDHTNTLTIDVKHDVVFLAFDSPDMWVCLRLSHDQAVELLQWLSAQLAETSPNGRHRRLGSGD